MNHNELFFISTIKDYLQGDITTGSNEIDWDIIFKYANNHQLTAIVYYQCKNFIPDTHITQFETASMQIISSIVRLRNEAEKVLTKLKFEEISHCVVKGFSISAFYPNWQFRTMGDIDILTNDRDKVANTLSAMGFSCIKSEGNERTYKKNGFEVELHDVLEYESDIVGSEDNKRFFNDYQRYVLDDKLDISLHFLYLFLHLRKHLMKYGVGFRQFLDIAVLTKNCQDLRWDWIEKVLYELKMLDFAKCVLSLNNMWFGVSSPINCGEVDASFYESATEYILDNGVFGSNNSANQNQIQILKMNSSKNARLFMLSDCIKKVLPSYNNMCSFSYCSFLIGKLYLLPAAWIKRIVHTITKQRHNSSKKSTFYVYHFLGKTK